GAEQMSHFAFQRIRTFYVAFAVEFVIGECVRELSGTVEHPSAKARGGRSAVSKVFVRQRLELFVGFVRKIRPVNLKAEDRYSDHDKYELPYAKASVGDRCSKFLTNFPGQIAFERE